jgi:hypothetical protein
VTPQESKGGRSGWWARATPVGRTAVAVAVGMGAITLVAVLLSPWLGPRWEAYLGARLEAHNADLRSQVETLTWELTARRREVTELHALVGTVSRALPAPASPVTPPDNPSSDPATPAVDPPATPTDSPKSPDPAADPLDSAAANRAWWRRAWDWFNGAQAPA